MSGRKAYKPKPYEPYEHLESKEVSVLPILNFHFKRAFASVYRKILFKQTFVNPWVVEVSEVIEPIVFYQWFKAVSDFSNFGREVKVIRDKKRKPKEYLIEFKHFGTFKFHCNKVLQEEEIHHYLRKENSATGEKAKILVSEENAAVFRFKISTGVMLMTMKYCVRNRYGVVISY